MLHPIATAICSNCDVSARFTRNDAGNGLFSGVSQSMPSAKTGWFANSSSNRTQASALLSYVTSPTAGSASSFVVRSLTVSGFAESVR